MYNPLYNHLYHLKLLHPPPSSEKWFQQSHLTDHAILQLMDQIHETFEDNK